MATETHIHEGYYDPSFNPSLLNHSTTKKGDHVEYPKCTSFRYALQNLLNAVNKMQIFSSYTGKGFALIVPSDIIFDSEDKKPSVSVFSFGNALELINAAAQGIASETDVSLHLFETQAPPNTSKFLGGYRAKCESLKQVPPINKQIADVMEAFDATSSPFSKEPFPAPRFKESNKVVPYSISGYISNRSHDSPWNYVRGYTPMESYKPGSHGYSYPAQYERNNDPASLHKNLRVAIQHQLESLKDASAWAVGDVDEECMFGYDNVQEAMDMDQENSSANMLAIDSILEPESEKRPPKVKSSKKKKLKRRKENVENETSQKRHCPEPIKDINEFLCDTSSTNGETILDLMNLTDVVITEEDFENIDIFSAAQVESCFRNGPVDMSVINKMYKL